MKLSFSTRGWMDMRWDEMLDAAKEMGFAGVEIYNVFKTPELYGKGGPLHKYTVAATARELRDKNLQIPCFDSSYDLSLADDAMLETLGKLMSLSSDMHVPYICAFAKDGAPERVMTALEALIPSRRKRTSRSSSRPAACSPTPRAFAICWITSPATSWR